MRYLVLGPLEVRDTETLSSSLPSRQRTVLAMMLLQANAVVPLEHLIDAVWGDAPPRTARSQVQICISQLRQRFASTGLYDVIATRPPGYSFRVQPGQLDLDVFRANVDEGREAVKNGDLEEGARHLREALKLWRGDVIADVVSDQVVSAATFYEEQRVSVTEECFEVELQLGKHHELVSEISALIDRYPFRERFRAQLMLSCYRSGRQAEALQVFRNARAVLHEELGVEPGQELRELERAVLVADPALEPSSVYTARDAAHVALASSTVPRLLPTALNDFTGRTRQIGLLDRRLAAPAQEPGNRSMAPVVEVVTGKGGVGKTTLAVQLAHELSDDYQDGQLYARLQDGALQPVPPGQVLENFLRALGVTGKEMPADLEGRAAMYRNRLAGRKTLVLLDNAVDEDQVLPLLPGTTTCTVLVTSRARLTGLPGAHQTVLQELDEDQAVELVENALGEDRRRYDLEQLRVLARLCGGLPLALRIAAARLAAHPHWTMPHLTKRLSDEKRTLDELAHGSLDIRENIALSCQQLPEDARVLFGRLSLIEAPDFGSWAAAGLAGTSIMDVEDILDTLLDAHLVEADVRPDSQPRYRLHDLIRLYAREQLESRDEASACAKALKRLMGACLYLAEQSHSREYGEVHMVLTGSAERWSFDSQEVDMVLGDPLEWLETELPVMGGMVHRACRTGDHELAWSLALPLITLFESRGSFGEWHRLHETVLGAVTTAGNDRGRAAMLYSLGTMYVHKEELRKADALLEQAQGLFHEIGDEAGGALAVRNRAYLARVRGDNETAMAGYEAALAVLRKVGDRVGQAHILNSKGCIRLNEQRFDDAARLLGEALECARATRSRRIKAQIFHRFGELRLALGHLESAADSFRAALSEVRGAGDRTGEAFSLHGLGQVFSRQGRYADAEETLSHALTLSRQSMQRLLTARILVGLADVHHGAGRPLKAARDLADAFPTFVSVGAVPWQVDVLRRFRVLEVPENESGLLSALTERIVASMAEGGAGDALEPHASALRRHLTT